MEYISAKEAATKWNIGVRRVQYYCANEKIDGAIMVGKQWLIPVTSKRPIDGRTKIGKKETTIGKYHFPLFSHTPHYAYSDDLDEDEKRLLYCEKTYLKGNYSESMKEAREILSKINQPHVVFGAYLMIAYNSIVLGLNSEFSRVIPLMENMYEKEKEHKEDYRLMLEGLKYHIRWDSEKLLSINVAKISSDACMYLHSMCLQSSLISAVKESKQSTLAYEAICKMSEDRGYDPIEIMYHVNLAVVASKEGKKELCEEHIKKFVDIVYKENLLGYGSKHYYVMSDLSAKYFELKDPKFHKEVKNLADMNLRSWQMISPAEKKTIMFKGFGLRHNEFLHLIACGFTNIEIGNILGLKQNDVRKTIETFEKEFNKNSRKELYQFVCDQFNGR